MEGGRLSRPRHCSRGAQPVPKAVNRSGCRDKHNRRRCDLNLVPLTSQSDALTTRQFYVRLFGFCQCCSDDMRTMCVCVGSPTDLTLELKDTKKKSSSSSSDAYMGCILIQCTLTTKSSLDYASQVRIV